MWFSRKMCIIFFFIFEDFLSLIFKVIVSDHFHVFVLVKFENEWRSIRNTKAWYLFVVQIGEILHQPSQDVLMSWKQNSFPWLNRVKFRKYLCLPKCLDTIPDHLERLAARHLFILVFWKILIELVETRMVFILIGDERRRVVEWLAPEVNLGSTELFNHLFFIFALKFSIVSFIESPVFNDVIVSMTFTHFF